MSDILIELESFVDYILALNPTSQIERQNVPRTVEDDLFVIRFQNHDPEEINHAFRKVQREYQLLYFSKDVQTTIQKIEQLEKQTFQSRFVIPLKNTLRYMTLVGGGFSFSQPFQTENDLYGINAVIRVEMHKARDFETYQKIMRVNTTIQGGE